MSQFFQIHPVSPQPRLVKQAVDIIRKGGVIAYPTDSAYALGCHLGDKKAADRIKRIRALDDKHNFTLVCRDLSDVGIYAKVGTVQYRLLKTYTPGAYTFILPATSEVPRRLVHPKRRQIGLRVPDNAVVQAILAELGEPLMSTTLLLPGEAMPMVDPDEIRDRLQHDLDLVIDGGFCDREPTTVVDLSEDVPALIREGKGDPEPFR
ncbi:L-threonylcarbamoyladenylate synthase [Hydrocarboniclastica marina]|uniref:Threonylcarbamoyl-AMP synthase n=1 Tax=Hydrocarboniclastica marina TaxID=2259620 RepID=A0A4P7XFN8_9ALTE|nr:L-threonylcarbamoyladenylate synthase [Hydrocarboniclastica marina]MAL97091.1 threonylcarbamoyl-AMP synthase [Alteromonadaceae bacterium]QCF25505.1 threonylcarbamoyl-AMP synthase [Hydrocarboniclastica marina]